MLQCLSLIYKKSNVDYALAALVEHKTFLRPVLHLGILIQHVKRNWHIRHKMETLDTKSVDRKFHLGRSVAN